MCYKGTKIRDTQQDYCIDMDYFAHRREVN